MKEIPFSNVIQALTNTDRGFPDRYVEHLSDLDSTNLAAFMAAWPQVSLVRKHALLKKLSERFDEDTLLSFENIAAQLLKDADTEVRIWALKLLKETVNTRLIPPLLNILLTDPEPEASIHAAVVLGQFLRMAQTDELPIEKGRQIEEALLKATRSESAAVARAALEPLGYSNSPEVDELIQAAFDRPDTIWQAAALLAAGHSADNRWQEQILSGLLSEDALVRLAAVQSAGELELKAARKPLLDMIEEEVDDDVMQAIVWSLSLIGGEDVRTYLETLLDQTEDDDQIEYIEDAIANLAFTEDLEKFDMLAYDPDDKFDVIDDDEE